MSSSEQHRRLAAERGPIALALVTVSDTRTTATDENGHYLRSRVEDGGHTVAHQAIIPDEPAQVLAALEAGLAAGARIIVFNGGTGISKRDNTYDALAGRMEKTLPGFGELFRMLSFEQVGSAAILSRATAGVISGAVVLSVPGSPGAVRLAWERLIEPELSHLAWELVR